MSSSNLILLDIFSYSCMNCLRSLGFIKKLKKKYRKFGLETILVHAPEWRFEKDSKNIAYALKKYKIDIPVIIDKDKKIIKKFKVDFWPSQILISNEKILYKRIGEGSYKKLENKISELLNANTERIFNKEPIYSKFPALYAGKRKKGKIKEFKNKLKYGIIYKKGKWSQKNEFIQSSGRINSLTILTKGRIISFVAETMGNKPAKIIIRLNDKYAKNLTVNNPRLYKILKLKNNKRQKLTIIAKPDLAIYSFSFQ